MKNKISGLFILVALVANSLTFFQTSLIDTASAQSPIPPVCLIVPITWRSGLDVTGTPGVNNEGLALATPKHKLLPGQMTAFKKIASNRYDSADAGTKYDTLDSKVISVSIKPCDFSSPKIAASKCISASHGKGLNITTTNNASKYPEYCQLPPEGTEVYYSLKINEEFNYSLNSCPPYHGTCEFYFYH